MAILPVNEVAEKVSRRFHYLMGQRDSARDRVRELKSRLGELDNRGLLIGKAQALVQEVAQETQEELRYKLADLVTLALQSVFPEPYRFVVRFTQKRGRTEAEMLVEREGMEIDPYEASGGGVVDVIAFALRLCLWRLKAKRTRATMILDEPFRFVSRDLQEGVGKMVAKISRELELQLIIVSHEEELISNADKVFRVTIRDGVSTVAAGASGDGAEAKGEEEEKG